MGNSIRRRKGGLIRQKRTNRRSRRQDPAVFRPHIGRKVNRGRPTGTRGRAVGPVTSRDFSSRETQTLEIFMRMMPFVATAVLVGLALPITPAAAAPSYPYCSRNATTAGDCSFNTFQECLEYLNGVGGACVPNPSYSGPAAAATPGVYDSASHDLSARRHRRHPDR